MTLATMFANVALGSTPRGVFRLVLSEGALLIGTGLAASPAPDYDPQGWH